MFAKLGVDGLLVEYEDMFPYERDLKMLQTTSQPAYRWVFGSDYRQTFVNFITSQ